jgi:hypothetical protein
MMRALHDDAGNKPLARFRALLTASTFNRRSETREKTLAPLRR